MGNIFVRLIARVLDLLHITVRTRNPYWKMAQRKGRLDDALIETPRPTRRFSPPGLPVANTVDADNSPVGIDQVLMKGSSDFPQVEIPALGIIAQQGIGKTFTAAFMLFVAAFNDVGTTDASGRPSRVRFAYDSFKVDKNGRPETSALVTDLFNCQVIDPTKVPLNYFSRAFGLTAKEQLELTTDQIAIWRAYSNKPPMSIEEDEVLRQLIDKMYGLEQRSFSVLAELADTYEPEVPDQHGVTKKYEELLYRAAFTLRLSLNNFVQGTLGKLFAGDDNDLFAQLIEQRAVSIHYRPLSDRERTHLELAMSMIQRTAIETIETPDGHRRRFPNRIQHYMVQDEAYGSWTNLVFAQRQYLRKKTQREFGIGIIEIFHQFTDMMEAIGAAGSEQARLARNSLNEINIWLVGRQKRSQFPILREILGLSDDILRTLPRLAKGHFWLIIPGFAPRLIWIKGTRTAIKYFNTEGATNELLQRYFADENPETYKQWLVASSPDIEPDAEEEKETVNALTEAVA